MSFSRLRRASSRVSVVEHSDRDSTGRANPRPRALHERQLRAKRMPRSYLGNLRRVDLMSILTLERLNSVKKDFSTRKWFLACRLKKKCDVFKAVLT